MPSIANAVNQGMAGAPWENQHGKFNTAVAGKGNVPALSNGNPNGLTSPGSTSGSKTVTSLLENYQKARLSFAQGVADCAAREAQLEHLAQPLVRSAIVPLLRPLLLDQVVSIQQAAALALGRLANHSPTLAAHVVAGDILPHIVYSLDSQNARINPFWSCMGNPMLRNPNHVQYISSL
jgi:hypothetical protein